MSKKDWRSIVVRKETREKLCKIRDAHDLSLDQVIQELLESQRMTQEVPK